MIEKHYKYPSRIRRFVFFIIWYIFTILVISTILNIISTFLALIGIISLGEAEYVYTKKVIFLFLIILLFFIIAHCAKEGYLPGAIRELIPQDEIDSENQDEK